MTVPSPFSEVPLLSVFHAASLRRQLPEAQNLAWKAGVNQKDSPNLIVRLTILPLPWFQIHPLPLVG